MKIKNALYFIVILMMIFVGAYLFTRPASKIEQAVRQPIQETQKTTAGIKVTFIELGSVGCTPCDMMSQVLDVIENEYDGQVKVRFYDVNTLLGKPYAGKYRVRAIPTQVFLDKDGKEYYRHIGFFPKEEVVKILQLRGVK